MFMFPTVGVFGFVHTETEVRAINHSQKVRPLNKGTELFLYCSLEEVSPHIVSMMISDDGFSEHSV